MDTLQFIATVFLGASIAIVMLLLVVARGRLGIPPALYRGQVFHLGLLTTIMAMLWISETWIGIVVGVVMIACAIGMAWNLWTFWRRQARNRD